MYPKNALRILFEFEPRAARRYNRGIVNLLARLIYLHAVINAGGPYELGNDNALRAVDDKGSVVRHKREIAHKYVLIDYLVGDLVYESYLNAKGTSIRRVSVPALFLVVLGLSVEIVVEKVKLEVVGIVGDRRKIFKHLAYSLANEGVVRIFLNFNEIRKLYRFFYLAESLSRDLAAFYFG